MTRPLPSVARVPPAIMRVKEWGLHRTFTNHLRLVVERNYPRVRVLMHEEGWKHGPIDGRRPVDADGSVVCAKHPWRWLASRRRYAEEKGRPWSPRGLLREYCHAYAGWMQSAPRPLALARHEDFLSDYQGAMAALAATLGLPVLPAYQGESQEVEAVEADGDPARLKPRRYDAAAREREDRALVPPDLRRELRAYLEHRRLTWVVTDLLEYDL